MILRGVAVRLEWYACLSTQIRREKTIVSAQAGVRVRVVDLWVTNPAM
jgi:hypothetical protein